MADIKAAKIIVPFAAYRCSFCGKPIIRSAQLKSRLWTIGGKPICTICLLLRFPKSGKLDYRKIVGMKSERERHALDVKKRDEIVDRKERQRVRSVAAQSQEAAARIDPKTKPHKH